MKYKGNIGTCCHQPDPPIEHPVVFQVAGTDCSITPEKYFRSTGSYRDSWELFCGVTLSSDIKLSRGYRSDESLARFAKRWIPGYLFDARPNVGQGDSEQFLCSALQTIVLVHPHKVDQPTFAIDFLYAALIPSCFIRSPYFLHQNHADNTLAVTVQECVYVCRVRHIWYDTGNGALLRMCANLSWKLKRLQTLWFDGIGRNNIKPVRERSRDEQSVTFGEETQEVACAG